MASLPACIISTKSTDKPSPSSQPAATSTTTPGTVNEDTAAEQPIDENNEINEINPSDAAVPESSLVEDDYALIVGAHSIPLRAWDYEMQLEEWLGDPLVESVMELTEAADTHTGSLVKNLGYEGLQLQLFSPSHNREQFWILSIDITSYNYATSRGIVVGDSLEKLKENYPNIEVAPDGRIDPNNCAYRITDADFTKFLSFEVVEGYISSIHMNYEIP